MEMLLGRVRLVLPSSSIVELHPVIFAIFDLPCVLQGLREQVSQVVVIRCVFEPKVADISEVLRKLFYSSTGQHGCAKVEKKEKIGG